MVLQHAPRWRIVKTLEISNNDAGLHNNTVPRLGIDCGIPQYARWAGQRLGLRLIRFRVVLDLAL